MATLTIEIDPSVLEAAKCEAERRQITLEQFVSESLSTAATTKTGDDYGHADLVRLMARAPLGEIGKPLLRDEIYEERTWPRS